MTTLEKKCTELSANARLLVTATALIKGILMEQERCIETDPNVISEEAKMKLPEALEEGKDIVEAIDKAVSDLNERVADYLKKYEDLDI